MLLRFIWLLSLNRTIIHTVFFCIGIVWYDLWNTILMKKTSEWRGKLKWRTRSSRWSIMHLRYMSETIRFKAQKWEKNIQIILWELITLIVWPFDSLMTLCWPFNDSHVQIEWPREQEGENLAGSYPFKRKECALST